MSHTPETKEVVPEDAAPQPFSTVRHILYYLYSNISDVTKNNNAELYLLLLLLLF